jgi:hypothetical protein
MRKHRIEMTLALIAMGGTLASCQAQTNWETFRDGRGVNLQIPQGWRGTADPTSTRVTVNGPRGERMTIWPAYLAEPLSERAAAAMLPAVARRVEPAMAWGAAAAAGPAAIRMAGRAAGQAAVGSVTWVNSPRGAAAWFVISAAPETQYGSTVPVFARIFGSLSLAPSPAAAPARARWNDPRENAFSLEVPADWRMEGGTLRRASVDVVFPWSLTSPDGAVRVTGGDGELPTFTVPNQMLAMAGFREGSWYSPGYGVRMQVRRYMPGLAFVRSYAASKASPGCSDLRVVEERDRTPELAAINAQYAQFRSMGMNVQATAGEVSFTCQRQGRPVAGYYFATTLLTQMQGNALWVVDQLYGYMASSGAEPQAEATLSQALESFQFNPQWVAMQQGVTSAVSKIVAQTQTEISRMSKESFEYRQKVTSEAARKFSNATLGLVDVRDPATGREFKVDNAADYHWIDVNGRITGTQTDARPMGIDPRLLVTLP